MELLLNDYGLELDSYLGSLYLPWHTIALSTALLIAYKIYKRKKNN
jgi:cell shape-determining protein MreD